MNEHLLTPETEAGLAANQRRALLYLVLYLLGMLLSAALAFLLPVSNQIFLAIFIAQVILLMIAHGEGFLLALDGAKSLDGDGCIRMRLLAARHREIDSFLRDIQNQHRQVVWNDLWQVNEWLRTELERERQRACREVNGIA